MVTSRKPDESDKRIGLEIARLRKDKKVSQAVLAARLGISTQQLGKYERGENRISSGRHELAMTILNGDAAPVGFSEDATPFEGAPTLKAQLEQAIDGVTNALDHMKALVSRM